MVLAAVVGVGMSWADALAQTAPGSQQTPAPAAPAPAAQTPAAPQPARPAVGIEVPAEYVIGPEDVLGVVFWRDNEMSGDVVVRPDGMITLPLLGDIRAVGLKPDILAAEIKKAAQKLIEDPTVSVVVRQINSRKVFITGQVTTPGAHPLTGPRTVMQLIALAGGLTEFADKKNITIVRTEGAQTKSFKLNYNDVARGKKLEQNILLKPGDTVIVP